MSETKTKNLCTVPAADLTDRQYFIAEDGGELKRIPKAQVVLKKLENMLATDTENLAGGGEVTAQELLDALAEQVANKLLAKSQVVNNLLATVEGNPLDATQGKALKELIDTTNNNLSVEVNNLTDLLNPDYYDPGADYYLRIYRVGNVKILSIAIKAKALTGNNIIASNIPEKLRPDKSAYIVIQGRDVGEWARATYTPVVLEISGISISISTGVNASKLTYISGMAAYV